MKSFPMLDMGSQVRLAAGSLVSHNVKSYHRLDEGSNIRLAAGSLVNHNVKSYPMLDRGSQIRLAAESLISHVARGYLHRFQQLATLFSCSVISYHHSLCSCWFLIYVSNMQIYAITLIVLFVCLTLCSHIYSCI